MIFPGHVAASVLCHRYLKADLRVALVAGVIPDVVDKLLYYGLRLVPSSRLPMHTLWAWLASALLLWATAWLIVRPAARPIAWSWLVGYGAHLLCDSPLVGGKLPFLWPWLAYDFSSAHMPFGFLFGLDRWPLATLIAEAALVALTLWDTRRRRGLVAQAAPAPTIPLGVPDA
jgi:membrane-bound metal-dependent hydrolase YbcI (DUF457 family)